LRRPVARASLGGVSKRGTLRASDADRDQVVERLHQASTEGRIGSDELEQRVSTALKARTYDELEATIADLPGSPRGRDRSGQVARRSAPGWALSTVRANPMLLLFVIPMVAVTAALVVAAAVVWSLIMVVFFMLGGRGMHPRPPWAHAARRGLRSSGRYWA
jgi:Domain of unknown function (DUF1707)